MVEEIIRKNEKGKNEVVRTRIMIGKKELKLQFTMPMWYRMEDEVCVMDELYDKMHSRGRFGKNAIPKLVEIMTDGEITAEEYMRNIDHPSTMRAVIDEIQRVIADAVTMKEKKYDDDSVHDVVLEEIEKKETRAD